MTKTTLTINILVHFWENAKEIVKHDYTFEIDRNKYNQDQSYHDAIAVSDVLVKSKKEGLKPTFIKAEKLQNGVYVDITEDVMYNLNY